MNDDVTKRLIKEHKDLYNKRQKLQKYLNKIDSGEIDYRNCDDVISLLCAQLYAMDTYLQILRLRLLSRNIKWEDLGVKE